ncbi:MAG: hypothetical protein F2813_00335 [Actinobacteria bacterium]|uniref:Unannotated protein n=1 Tax=freshwater metagenome TaxID=449393 RepID=A0A6J5YZ89_9ZZZZ|nr:hypothetical protein [Actinomycetota bacterium]
MSGYSSTSIDIAEVRRSADLVAVARSLGVDLRQDGAEFVGCCPLHSEKTPSFTIFQGRTDGVWRWKCFGCDEGGDVIDLVEKVQGIGTGEAIRFLAGDRPAGPNVRREALPPPADPYAGIEILPPPAELVAGRRVDLYNPKRSKNGAITPAAAYPYKSADGSVFGYVLRHDLPDGGKETPMVCWVRLPDGRECWARMPFPRPRALYGLDRLGLKGQVLVVEGEKCADALWLLRGRPVVSWAGGTHGATHADWSALAGRDVIVWPDADRPGYETAARVADLLAGIAQRVRFLDPMKRARTGEGEALADGEPYTLAHWLSGFWPAAGFDVADAVDDDWSKAEVVSLMGDCVTGDLPDWQDGPSGPQGDGGEGENEADDTSPDEVWHRDQEEARDAPSGGILSLPGASRVSAMPKVHEIEHGSEVFVAQAFARSLKALFHDRVVHAENGFWIFDETAWARLPDRALRLGVHQFDAALVNGKTPLKLTKRSVDGILAEVGTILSVPGFFDDPTVACNVESATISITRDGAVVTKTHDPDDRFRFTLPTRFELDTPMNPPEGSMLNRLLQGSFRDDADASAKIDLVGEILGAAAFGLATRLKQPKAFVFLGESASNGKSTIASLLSSLLPEGAVSSIAPAHFEDERRVVGLVGRAANVADEISAAAISGETFKAAITGDTVSGRDLYRSAITFKPRALHAFTTNVLPKFSGYLDRGLQRRLMVLRFERTIPASEVIPDIAEQIATNELDLLLGFAIAGARRLIMRGEYTVPASSVEALKSWILLDPVAAWFEERVQLSPTEPAGGWMRASDLFKDFRTWAIDNGHSERFLPPVTSFGARLKAMPGVDTKHTRRGSIVMGIVLTEGGQARPNLDW